MASFSNSPSYAPEDYWDYEAFQEPAPVGPLTKVHAALSAIPAALAGTPAWLAQAGRWAAQPETWRGIGEGLLGLPYQVAGLPMDMAQFLGDLTGRERPESPSIGTTDWWRGLAGQEPEPDDPAFQLGSMLNPAWYISPGGWAKGLTRLGAAPLHAPGTPSAMRGAINFERANPLRKFPEIYSAVRGTHPEGGLAVASSAEPLARMYADYVRTGDPGELGKFVHMSLRENQGRKLGGPIEEGFLNPASEFLQRPEASRWLYDRAGLAPGSIEAGTTGAESINTAALGYFWNTLAPQERRELLAILKPEYGRPRAAGRITGLLERLYPAATDDNYMTETIINKLLTP